MSTKEREQWSTKEKVAVEAKKYNTKADFAKNSQSAYQAARRLNCLDEVCAHMAKPKRGRKKGSTKTAAPATTTTVETTTQTVASTESEVVASPAVGTPSV